MPPDEYRRPACGEPTAVAPGVTGYDADGLFYEHVKSCQPCSQRTGEDRMFGLQPDGSLVRVLADPVEGVDEAAARDGSTTGW